MSGIESISEDSSEDCSPRAFLIGVQSQYKYLIQIWIRELFMSNSPVKSGNVHEYCSIVGIDACRGRWLESLMESQELKVG